MKSDKSDKTDKTNAARLLDRAKVPYTLVPYEVDEEHLDAFHVADSLGEDINMVFKTIVLVGERHGHAEHFVCVVPGNAEIDLKKAAKAFGAKKADLIAMKELLPLTGYIRGGCTAIGMKKPFQVFLHSSATAYEQFYISAGRRGLQICMSPADYISFTSATVADLIKDQLITPEQ